MASRRNYQRRRAVGWALAGIAAMATWIVRAGDVGGPQIHSASASALRRPTGQPQLISYEPLPIMDGAECQWVPASASTSLLAALQLEQTAARAATTDSPDAAKREEVQKRQPVRVIRDPYAGYSSVAVDPIRNEVVLTDENLFQVLVYDRLADTPPAAKWTEPKRILGGLNTKIEFQCGLYIDPATGDIYAVNNDTVDTLVIFDRQAKGDVPPTRELYTPHGTFGIAVDEEQKELFLTVQHDNAVVVFEKMATKDEPPIRLLQGNNTLLADPHGLALDTKNDLIFVSNFGAKYSSDPNVKTNKGRQLGRGDGKPNWPLGYENAILGSGKISPPSITVYPKKASGNTAPLRVIQGPKARLNWPTGLAVDSERGELYIANDMGDEILVFNVTDQGDVAPKRILQGTKTQLKNPTGIWLDLKNDELWVANFGNHKATVYPLGAAGDTAPLRVIRSGPEDEAALMIGNPHPVGYDSKREEILVPN